MSGELASPRDLCIQTLAQMLWIERTLAFEVLPDLQKQVKSESLAALVEEHLGQTHQHVARVEVVMRGLGAEPASARSAPLAGAKQQHGEVAPKITEQRLADLFHAAAAIETEHIEVAGYRLVLLLLDALDRKDLAETIAANANEDAQTLERLNEHAERLRGELA